jgi:hypothetical protein
MEMRPHVTIQNGGDVVFEWWKGQRYASVVVSGIESWYMLWDDSVEVTPEDDGLSHETILGIWRFLGLETH